ncbi:unnamed protein product [Caenorhabditis sp. 36 PRJEB53466]|nr:unnamed protein product [Caenorhabditis sp. 36 PRJEB53466]
MPCNTAHDAYLRALVNSTMCDEDFLEDPVDQQAGPSAPTAEKLENEGVETKPAEPDKPKYVRPPYIVVPVVGLFKKMKEARDATARERKRTFREMITQGPDPNDEQNDEEDFEELMELVEPEWDRPGPSEREKKFIETKREAIVRGVREYLVNEPPKKRRLIQRDHAERLRRAQQSAWFL